MGSIYRWPIENQPEDFIMDQKDQTCSTAICLAVLTHALLASEGLIRINVSNPHMGTEYQDTIRLLTKLYELVIPPIDMPGLDTLAMVYELRNDYRNMALCQEIKTPQAPADQTCPYCQWVSSAEGESNRKRSLSAHIRQMHPDNWNKGENVSV